MPSKNRFLRSVTNRTKHSSPIETTTDRRCQNRLVQAVAQLRDGVGPLRFGPPVTQVYNPLDYAWDAHIEYLARFGEGRKKVLFLGMNPGPFGMVQTGIPFGEVNAVRDWLGIVGRVERPPHEHPKRPVTGFDCRRSEVSGLRLWGLFARRFGDPPRFFSDHFVANYCPLAFFEAGGRNRTPDQLSRRERVPLFEVCDRHLRQVVEVMKPEWLIGIGGFAAERIRATTTGLAVKTGRILHPSPASPAANRDWAGTVTRQLEVLGVW